MASWRVGKKSRSIHLAGARAIEHLSHVPAGWSYGADVGHTRHARATRERAAQTWSRPRRTSGGDSTLRVVVVVVAMMVVVVCYVSTM